MLSLCNNSASPQCCTGIIANRMISVNLNAVLIRRGIGPGMQTLSRDRGWRTAFLGIVGMLLCLQIMVLALVTLQAASQVLITGSALRLEVRDTASSQDIQDFLVAAKDQPEIDRVEYVTKEQAYETERKRAGDLIVFLEKFKIANPFPDTVSVTLHSLNDFDAFSAFVRQPQWSTVVNLSSLSAVGDQERDIERMSALTSSLQTLGIALGILLLLVCGAFVIEFVRRRAMMRRDEILVERAAGAPAFSIIIPFATESAVLLLLGAALSAAVLALIVLLLPALLPGLAADGSLLGLRAETSRLLLLEGLPIAVAEAVLLILLSVAGAWLAVRPRPHP